MIDKSSASNRVQEFARCGEALWRLAEELGPDGFPSAFITLIRNAIRFDGATVGRGWIGSQSSGMQIENAHVYGRRPDLLDEWKEWLRHDPLTERFLQGLDSPLVCSLPDFYRMHGASAMQAFATRHELSQVLLFGEIAGGSVQWLAFYRKTDTPFADEDAAFLQALWPMFRYASRMNLLRALERADETRHGRAMALLNHSGGIEAADNRFHELLREEVPQQQGGAIPIHILQVLMQGRSYRGRRTEIEMRPLMGRAVCTIRRRPGISLLSQAETRVAEHLLTGLSYKQIALRTGTSPNTVRNQIAQLYRKLGVHDKLALVSALQVRPAANPVH